MKKSGFSVIYVILAVLVLISVLGFAFLWIQNQKLSTQIEDLKRIPQSQVDTRSFPTGRPSASPTPTDLRQLLLPDDHGIYFSFDKYGEACNGSKAGNIYNVPANDEVAFKNDYFGFSASLPTNSKWFSDIYRLNPYDLYETSVSYGPIGVVEGCGMGRANSIIVVPQRNVQLILNDLNNRKAQNNGLFWVWGPIVKELGGNTVVEWEETGLCNNANAEVVGKKHNYNFGGSCLGDLSEVEKTIEKMKIY